MLLAEAQKDRGVELRSPVPGQNPVYDLSGPTIGNYKTLPTSPHGEKPPPHTRLGAQWVYHNFPEGVVVKKSLHRPALLICMSAFPAWAPPFRSLFTGESAEVLFFLSDSVFFQS